MNFRERIARLAGSTTWREPMGGHGTDPSRPTDQDVAAVLAMSRRRIWLYGMERPDPQDIGPDVAYAIYTGTRHRKSDVMQVLVSAVTPELPKRLRRKGRVGMAANAAYEEVVFGCQAQPHRDIPAEDWRFLVAVCVGVMLNEAEGAIARAERKFYAAA